MLVKTIINKGHNKTHKRGIKMAIPDAGLKQMPSMRGERYPPMVAQNRDCRLTDRSFWALGRQSNLIRR